MDDAMIDEEEESYAATAASESDGDDDGSFIGTSAYQAMNERIHQPVAEELRDVPHMVMRSGHVKTCQVLFKTLKDLLNNCSLVFNPTGMFMTATDSTRVSLVDLQVRKEGFVDGFYDCNYNYRIGVDVQTLAEFVFYGRTFDIVEFRLEGANPDYLYMDYEKGNNRQTQKLRLILNETEGMDPDQLLYNSSVVLLSQTFKEVINRYKGNQAIKSVILIKTPTQFVIKVDQEMGTIEDHFHASEQGVTFHEIGTSTDEIRARFATRYLMSFTKITKATKYVTIYMPEEADEDEMGKPLKLEYELAAWGKVSFYLGPKVEDAEDME